MFEPSRPRGLARVLPAALAVLAGLAQAVSIASPFDGAPLWWLQPLSLALLVAQLDAAPGARSAALRGWLFAIAWLSGTFWWLFISMHTYGGLAAPLAALAVLGLAAFLGLYYAAAAAVYRAARPAGIVRRALLFGGLWLLAELLRAGWFTGFPWGAGGYAHADGAARWLAPLVGVYGIGALAAVAAAALAGSLRARRPVVALLAAAGFVAASCWPVAATEDGRSRSLPLSIELLQGNIPQDEKFQPGSGVPVALDWYLQRLKASTATLVVAPETAVPVLPQDLPPGYADALHQRFAQGQQAALVGIPLVDAQQTFSNAALGLKPGQALPYVYEKHHLVPFGEFIPPLFRWFTEMMNIPLGDFREGALVQPPLMWQGQRVAPNICYEDLFGDELARRFADPAQSPTVMVNMSNIGWFGDSIAIDQHLTISRLRAMEFDRPMVRATNTGATVAIDRKGRVTASLAPFTRDVLRTQVDGRDGPPTFYARWASRFGNGPLWLAGALVALLAVVLPGRRTRRQRPF